RAAGADLGARRRGGDPRRGVVVRRRGRTAHPHRDQRGHHRQRGDHPHQPAATAPHRKRKRRRHRDPPFLDTCWTRLETRSVIRWGKPAKITRSYEDHPELSRARSGQPEVAVRAPGDVRPGRQLATLATTAAAPEVDDRASSTKWERRYS